MDISEQVKQHLIKKLEDCQIKISKLERKRKIIKNVYIVTMLLSIVCSAVLAVISSVATVPFIVIPILSSISTILTGISAKFNLHDKKSQMKVLIDKLNRIKSKLEYVISCNGDLTQAEYDQILKDF